MVALLKIGGVASSLQVMRNEEVVYERDQAFGGSQLTQNIVRQYGFSVEEAEIKKRNADLPDDYATSVLAPFVESLSVEIVRALQFFFTSSPYNKVDHVLLAGGSAALPGLPESVALQSGFGCSVANPFEEMKLGNGVRSSARTLRDASSYLTACGLAMRRFLQ
jgi:type IV pilus assembly protein PilM